MEPRLKESTKWTDLPEELRTQIQDALTESFAEQAKVGRFRCEGRIYKTEVLIQLGYLENGRLAQANAEASVDYDFQKQNVQDIIGFAVDMAGTLLDSFFENPNEDFPREWKSFVVEKQQVYLRFSTVNSELEKQADQLLGIDSNDGLVKGDTDSETVDAIKSSLGLDDDDDEGSNSTH